MDLRSDPEVSAECRHSDDRCSALAECGSTKCNRKGSPRSRMRFSTSRSSIQPIKVNGKVYEAMVEGGSLTL